MHVCKERASVVFWPIIVAHVDGFVVHLARGKSFIYQAAFMGKICVGILIYSKGWAELQLCENEINVRPSYSCSHGLYNDGALIQLTKVL